MKYPVHLSTQKMLKAGGLDIKAWCEARSIYVEEAESVLFVNDEEFQEFLLEYKSSLKPSMIANLCNLEVSRFFCSMQYYPLTASNALEGLKRYIEFRHRIGPIEIEAKEEKGQMTLRFVNKHSRMVLDGPLLLLEKTLLINILCQGGGRLCPLSSCKMPDTYGENINEYTFPISNLQFPLLKENNYMARYLEKAMAPYYANLMNNSQSFTKVVINELIEGLPSGEYHVVQLAKRLDLSERSLQRHLQDEGVQFKRLLREVHQMMIKVYLDLNVTSEEIAFLTGFASLREFLSSFRTWFGMGVAAYKERLSTYEKY